NDLFTGLVEVKGKVIALEKLRDSISMQFEAPDVTADAQLGDSISVNIVCVTVADIEDATFTAYNMQESLTRSALGQLAPHSTVNLERALLPTTRLGGHIVQGHVDGPAQLISRTPSEHWEVLRFELPRDLGRYVVEKGSIAISGTSL